MIIDAIIEIPKNSKNKYEYDKEFNLMRLDRVLYDDAYSYPFEYGFVPNTLDDDGDPLDILVLATYPITFPIVLKVRVLTSLNMNDQGEEDTKLFAVVNNDPRLDIYQVKEDLPKNIFKEIEFFFSNYKKKENKKVILNGWNNIEKTGEIIKYCQDKYQNEIKKNKF
jgi:inorganic pyrophosphatase